MSERQRASQRNSPQEQTPITRSELRMRWELTPVQKQQLNPILVARDDIRNFDYPPEDGEWVKNRSYQTREEAINAFIDLTGTTPEHATKIFDDQKKAHANMRHWEAESVQRAPGDNRQPFLRYCMAKDSWRDTIEQESALIASAIRDPSHAITTSTSPTTVK